MRMSMKRNESFTARPHDEALLGDGFAPRKKQEGSFKNIMSKIKEFQPNTTKVSRRENNGIYQTFEHLDPSNGKKKNAGGYFIER